MQYWATFVVQLLMALYDQVEPAPLIVVYGHTAADAGWSAGYIEAAKVADATTTLAASRCARIPIAHLICSLRVSRACWYSSRRIRQSCAGSSVIGGKSAAGLRALLSGDGPGVISSQVATRCSDPPPQLTRRQLSGTAAPDGTGKHEQDHDEGQQDSRGPEAARDVVRQSGRHERVCGKRQRHHRPVHRIEVEEIRDARRQQYRGSLADRPRGAEDDRGRKPGSRGRERDVPDRAPVPGAECIR